jgi:hypothetical protein
MLTQRDWLEPCYSNRLVQPFVRYLSAQRIASNQLGSLLALEADARVPMRTLASLIEDCEPAGASADLGLRVARAMPGPVGGLVHHVASSAERLEQAIVCMTRYARLMHEGAELQLAVQDGVARIGARLPASAEVADFFMVALWRSFVHWTGQELACEAWFRQPEPADLTPYRAVLPGVRLRFDAPCQALGFDAKLLSLPLPRADVDLHTLLVRQADDQLARLPEARSLTKRVRSLLLAQMHEGTADTFSLSRTGSDQLLRGPPWGTAGSGSPPPRAHRGQHAGDCCASRLLPNGGILQGVPPLGGDQSPRLSPPGARLYGRCAAALRRTPRSAGQLANRRHVPLRRPPVRCDVQRPDTLAALLVTKKCQGPAAGVLAPPRDPG